MAKAKIKMNALERWQKCGELRSAISNALPQELRGKPDEEIFSGAHDAVITPAIREMYNLMLRLQANSYGQNV
jgi:hypothetical protein